MASLIFTYDLAPTTTSKVLTLGVTPVIPSGYDISVDWGDGVIQNNITGANPADISHTYTLSTPVTVTVTFNTQTVKCEIVSRVAGKDSGLTACTQFPTNLEKIVFGNARFLTSVPNTLPPTITDLSYMFFRCTSFNQDIGGWDTSNVTNMSHMFNEATFFNKEVGYWNTSNVTDMSGMFLSAERFNNGDIGDNGTKPLKFNTSRVTNMENMFISCDAFNQDVSTRVVTVGVNTYTTWDTFNVTNMNNMFTFSNIFNNGDIGNNGVKPLNWDTSNVTGMEGLFQSCNVFNQNISTKVVTVGSNTYTAWDTSNVTNMNNMLSSNLVFNNGSLNNDGIDPLNWNTSNVTNMGGLFTYDHLFNQDISTKVVTIGGNTYTSWNTSNVTNMSSMLQRVELFNNGDTGNNNNTPLNWDTSSVTRMDRMFASSESFNQDISTQVVTIGGNTYTSWDVSSVTNMAYMLFDCSLFNQNLSSWQLTSIGSWNLSNYDSSLYEFGLNTSISIDNYSAMLVSWSNQAITLNGRLDISSKYNCPGVAQDARLVLTGTKGWIINDGGCYVAVVPKYADITFGIPSGLGTIVSPFNKSDLDLYLENNVVDDDIINIKGHLELSDSEPLLFPMAFAGAGPISVEFRGWDIETLGCPIIRWTFDDDYSLNTLCNKNTWWNWHVANNITATFKNFIIQSNTYFVADVGGNTISTFKDVLFIANDFHVAAGGGGGGSQLYLGCTINSENLYIEYLANVAMADCVLDTNTVKVDFISNFYTLNTVTTIDNFIDYITNTPLTYYTDVITKPIESTMVLPNFNSFVSYYTNKNALYYKLFNVVDTNSPVLTTFRNDYGYNNGLFNEPRLSYGAYSFVGSIPIVSEVFPTSGVIGSFYFGGDFTNVTVSNSTALSVTLEPNSTNMVSVAMDTKIKDKGIFELVTANRNDYVETQQSLNIDFVAKKRRDSVYPKFCECLTVDCATTDITQYNAPIVGGNPIIVDFSACAKSYGIYENYIPIKYNWYFDYGNDVTVSASTDIPYATHTYCGGYMEGYDVRLCVDFISK